MLTGIDRVAAEPAAKRPGIDNVEAEVCPKKGAAVKRLQADGRKVAIAGDGGSCAPALAQADVGIAKGARVP